MLRQALFDIPGPVAVRYPRGGEGAFRADTAGKAAVCLRPGTDVTIAAYGVLINHALAAAELLEKKGISAEVVKLNRISPLEIGDMEGCFGHTDTLLVVEDSFGAGCVGQRVASILAEIGKAPDKLVLLNLGKTYAPEGTVQQLEERIGLDAASIARAAAEAINNEQ